MRLGPLPRPATAGAGRRATVRRPRYFLRIVGTVVPKDWPRWLFFPVRAHITALAPQILRSLTVIPAIGERCAYGVDRNRRYEAGGKEPGQTNSNRKYARQRLPRDEITITNREASNESEIDRIPERPALNKTNQQAHGKLNS